MILIGLAFLFVLALFIWALVLDGLEPIDRTDQLQLGPDAKPIPQYFVMSGLGPTMHVVWPADMDAVLQSQGEEAVREELLP